MEEKKQSSSLMHDFKQTQANPNSMKLVGIFIVIILLGIGSGYALAHMSGGGSAGKAPGAPTYSVSSGKTFGSDNTKDFPDTAEGTLKTGGIEGEGVFHLVRPGGDSQNVYMTSSTVDLTQFVDKKVKVWGKTQTAQHAGWLMDVGKVEVL